MQYVLQRYRYYKEALKLWFEQFLEAWGQTPLGQTTDLFANNFEVEVDSGFDLEGLEVDPESTPNPETKTVETLLPTVTDGMALVLPEGFTSPYEADMVLIETMKSKNRLILVPSCFQPTTINFWS